MKTTPYVLFLLVLFLSFFPAIGFSKEKISFDDLFQEEKLEDWKKNGKAERSDLVVSTLLHAAETSLLKGNQAKAIDYAERAVRFAPDAPLPHFFLSHAISLTDHGGMVRVTTEYITAVKLFWYKFDLLSTALGIIGLSLFGAVLLTVITFLLYSYVVYTRWWIHYFEEQLHHRIHPYVLGGALIFSLYGLFRLLPLFWFILISLFFFWFFYRPTERKIAIFCLGSVLFVSLALGPALALLTFKQDPLLDQMVKNQRAEFLWTAPLPPSTDATSSNWRIPFLEASYRMQEHDWKNAETLYQKALQLNPDSVLILNNLGNVFFYQNHLDQALHYYQEALRVSPNHTAASYNISQVYKEKLLFREGEEEYRHLKEKAPEEVNHYTQMTTTYPDYPVMETRFTQKDLWRVFLKTALQSDGERQGLEQIWRGSFSWGQFIMLAFFTSLGLWAFCRYLSSAIMGDCCFICFSPICEHCQKKFSTYSMCANCGKDIKTAVSQKRGSLPKRIYPFLILPGGGQWILHQPVRAFIVMLSFYFFVILIVSGDTFFSSAYGSLSLEKSLPLWISLILLYVVSMYNLLRQIKEMRWHSKGL